MRATEPLAEARRAGAQRAALLALGLFVLVRALTAASVHTAAEARGLTLVRLLTKWDAQWYAGIAENGYGFVGQHPDGRSLADYAFFPLYPATERLVASVTGLAYPVAGVVVSVVAALAAAGGIFAVARRVLGDREALVVVVLWATLPVSVVQTMAYSESLFTALAAWSLHAVLAHRWLLGALLACGAGLTRPVGASVVIAVVVATILGSGRVPDPGGRHAGQREWARRLSAVVIAASGLAAYLAWVAAETGDPAGYFAVVEDWGNTFDGGRAFASWTVAHVVSRPLIGATLAVGLTVLAGLVAACVRQRQPLPLLVYSVVLVALALTTSGYFGSKPRYLLPAFPLLFPVASWLANRPTWVTVSALTVSTSVSVAYAAIWLLGPGPP